MDKQSPTIKVIIHGQEVSGSIVNVINKVTCDCLGITTSILVTNDKYQYGPTNRIHLTTRYCYW